LPAVFAVPGRTAVRLFVEFGGPFPGFVPSARDYEARVDVRLGHSSGWGELVTVALRFGGLIDPDHYLAYSNRPKEITPEVQGKANAALARLIEQIGSGRERVESRGNDLRDGDAG